MHAAADVNLDPGHPAAGPLATPARAALPLERRPARALYVHLPFCARRCPYCDFATAPLSAALERRYLDALAAEAAARVPAGFRPRTVFLGGGTPAELTTDGVARLVALLGPLARGAREVTVEANPRTLLPRKLSALVTGLGVTRVSLGAQSFDEDLLARLGRFHRPADVTRAVGVCRDAGVRDVNIDLMFAVPGQTRDALDRDLDAALALEPEHVSLYGLTFEQGTRYFDQREAGELVEVHDARQARLYARARRALRAAGFEHYEVSNFARPGRRCRHNVTYWRNHPYLGLGNGAASHLDGVRSVNHRDVEAYCAAVAAGDAVASRERLAPERKVRETAYLAARTSAGLSRARFLRDAGVAPDEALGPELAALVAQGLMKVVGERWMLTGRGVALADRVGEALL